MYLCLGVLMTLMSKQYYGKRNYAYQKNVYYKIFQDIITKIDLEDRSTSSKLSNCKRPVPPEATDYCSNASDNLIVHQLEKTSIELQKSILDKKHVKEFVSSIIFIIEHDDSISSDTTIGLDKTINTYSGYTRAQLLSATCIDLTEFLINILFYVFTSGDNCLGKDTLSFLKNNKNTELNIKGKNIKIISYEMKGLETKSNDYTNTDNIFPQNLTDYSVVGASKNTVLFRESEYNYITNSLNSGTNIILLSGMGGRGKTSLARLIYCSSKDNYDYYGWINYSENLNHSLIHSIRMNNYQAESSTPNEQEEKYKKIEELLCDKSVSKLLIIDNVDYIDKMQNPYIDIDLIKMSNWRNTKILLTSRLPNIPGCDKIIHISNLGNDDNYTKCVELFYYFNPKAETLRHSNSEIVKQLCSLASYNTMVIELLAKASLYNYDDLNDFYTNLERIGFHYTDDVPVSTDHQYTKPIMPKNDGSKTYETASSQLISLFNLKTRSDVEQQIIWEFHCLPEGEKISQKELVEFFGYHISDIISLEKEGWITFKDDHFSIHPLIKKAVEAATFYNSLTDNTWKNYWENGIKIRAEKNFSSDIISSLLKNDLSFFQRIENTHIIYMLHQLTLSGKLLDNITLFNLGYGFFKYDSTCAGIYLDTLYERIIKSQINVYDSNTCAFVSKCISLRYMLATEGPIMSEQAFYNSNKRPTPTINNIVQIAITLLFLQHNSISKLKDSMTIMSLYLVISDYILSFCFCDTYNDKILEFSFQSVLKENSTKDKIYCNGQPAFSLPDKINSKSKTAICLSFLKYIERKLKPIIISGNYDSAYLEFWTLTMYNLGKFYHRLSLSELIKHDIFYCDPILEFGKNDFHIVLSWNDIAYSYKYSEYYYEQAIFYQLNIIDRAFPNLNNNTYKALTNMCYSFSLLLKNLPSLFNLSFIFDPGNICYYFLNSTNEYILRVANLTEEYATYLTEENKCDERCLFYFDLSLRCYNYILENNPVNPDEIRKNIENLESKIQNK